MKSRGAIWLAAIFVASLVGQANGQEFPSRPITIVVPYAAGGGADLFARVLQDKMSLLLKQPFIVEAKPGASTTIGAAAVARAEPDGYTLLLTTTTSHAVSGLTVANLPYHPLDSFAPIAKLAVGPPNLVIVPEFSRFKNIRDVVDAAKAKPGTITYATTGVGTGVYLVGQLLSLAEDVQFVHVPYKGASPSMQAAMAGHVDFAIVDGGSIAGQQELLRFLGASSKKRWGRFPDVPTLIEQGFPVDIDTGVMVMAPAKTPQAIVQKINAALRETANSPDVHTRLVEMGYEVDVTSSDELARDVSRDLARFGKVLKQMDPTSQ